MTTATTSMVRANQARPLISRAGWLWIVIIGALFVLLHQEFLHRSWLIAMSNNNWSHSLILPLISVYFIYQKRDALAALERRISVWGLPILLVGLFSYAWALYPVRNDMIRGYSMILTLFGLVLFLFGFRMMRLLWLPIVYLVLGVKVSDQLWDHLAWNLQQLAAAGATLGLKFVAVFMNFSVIDRGATIDLTFMQHGKMVTHGLNVAEACSGLRMLMAFMALGVALAFLWDRRWWQRAIMILSIVPIALGVNIIRVIIIGILYTYNQQMATGDFHKFIGMLMLLPAAGLFLLLGWILDHIFIDEPNRQPRSDRHRTETPPAPAVDLGQGFRIRDVVRGALIGGLLGLFAGGSYILVLTVIRPDLTHGRLWPWTAQLLLAGALGGLIALALGYRRLVPRGNGPAATHRLTVSLSVAAALLLVATVGQNTVIAVTKTVLIKQPVPLRRQLGFIPNRLGPWKKLGPDQILPPSVVEALGTDHYLTRYYVDRAAAAAAGDGAAVPAGDMVRLHVAYYTGTPDTVPHVPDRCFVAGGVRPIGTSEVHLHVGGPGYVTRGGQLFANSTLAEQQYGKRQVRIPSATIPATIFTFTPGNGSNQKSNVIYFYVSNNKFLSGPDAVRLQGFSPWDKYGYYCKVEVLVPNVGSRAKAVKRVSAFLSAALPEIMAALPDWRAVTAGRYPRKSNATIGSGRAGGRP